MKLNDMHQTTNYISHAHTFGAGTTMHCFLEFLPKEEGHEYGGEECLELRHALVNGADVISLLDQSVIDQIEEMAMKHMKDEVHEAQIDIFEQRIFNECAQSACMGSAGWLA